jgi:hypothetical protein
MVLKREYFSPFLVFRLTLVVLGFKMLLPPNMTLVAVGGILGVFGIYLLYKQLIGAKKISSGSQSCRPPQADLLQ